MALTGRSAPSTFLCESSRSKRHGQEGAKGRVTCASLFTRHGVAMKRFACGILSLFVALSACATPSPDVTDTERSAIVTAVSAAFDTLSKAIIAHDYDRVEGLHADGDDVALAMDGVVTIGRPAIMAGFRGDTTGTQYLEYRWENTRVRVLDRHAALHVTGFWERLLLKSGDTVEVQGTFTNGFQRIGERWQVVHMAASHKPAGVP